MSKKFIYILNFGDYYARLTARKVRLLGGKPRIVTFNTPFSSLKDPAGFILSGSPYNSIRIPIKLLNREMFASGLPVMGICVGAQLIARYFGGGYKALRRCSENGIVDMYLVRRGRIFRGMKKYNQVLMLHNDSIISLSEDFVTTAYTQRCPIAAARHKKKHWYLLQFHPELSPCGDTILKNFLNFCYDFSFEFPEKMRVALPKKKKIMSQKEEMFF